MITARLHNAAIIDCCDMVLVMCAVYDRFEPRRGRTAGMLFLCRFELEGKPQPNRTCRSEYAPRGWRS